MRDVEMVDTELMLADLDSLEKRMTAAQKRARGGDKEAIAVGGADGTAGGRAREGRPVRRSSRRTSRGGEAAATADLEAGAVCLQCRRGRGRDRQCILRARSRSVRAGRRTCRHRVGRDRGGGGAAAGVDRAEFLEGLGLHDSGLDRVIRAGYDLLGLLTFFTVGPKEAHAWTIERGTKAPQAAGAIHGDFERGFIACETIGYDDYVACKGEAGAKDAGKMRVEGKEYVVKDGDVLLFRFNV